VKAFFEGVILMARATLSFPARKLHQSPGWIAPNGRFFPCLWYEHDSQAEELARRYYPDEARCKSGTQIFEEKRWVRLLENGAFRVGFDLATINSENDFSRRLLMWLDQAEDY
jgi:hypothetical protein